MPATVPSGPRCHSTHKVTTHRLMDATHSRHLNRTVLCAAVSSADFNFLLLTAMVNDNARSFTVGPFVRPAFFA